MKSDTDSAVQSSIQDPAPTVSHEKAAVGADDTRIFAEFNNGDDDDW